MANQSLIFDSDDGGIKQSTFNITKPTVIRAAGLSETDVVPVYMAVGECFNCGPTDIIWEQVYLCDKPLEITQTNNVIALTLEGKYALGNPNDDPQLSFLNDVNITKQEGVDISQLGKCDIETDVSLTGLYQLIDPEFIDSDGRTIDRAPVLETVDENGELIELYYINPANGTKVIIGTNDNLTTQSQKFEKEIQQYRGSVSIDYFANGQNLTLTPLDIITEFSAAGFEISLPDGTTKILDTSDYISSIVIGLKEIGSNFGAIGSVVQSTTSEATIQSSGKILNFESRMVITLGENQTNDLSTPINFDNIQVLDGSIITVVVSFASAPQSYVF